MATLETTRSEAREETRRALDGYRAWCTLNGRLLEQIEAAESRLKSVTAQMGEIHSGSFAKDALGDNIASQQEAADRLRDQSFVVGETLDVLLSVVDGVIERNPLCGQVLTMRYIDDGRRMTLDDIAEELGYTPEWIREKHLEALDIAGEIMRQKNLRKPTQMYGIV